MSRRSHHRRARRGLAAVVAALVAALALAACGGSGGGSNSGARTTTTAARVPGGKVVVAFASDAQTDASSLDPNLNGAGRNSHTIMSALYDTLVYQDPTTGKIVPGLATRWIVSPQADQYTFYLNPNARFWDGTPVTADDVKFSIERAINIRRYALQVAYSASLLSAYERSDVIDDHTIKITFRGPQASVLELGLSRDYFSIISKAYTTRVGDRAFGARPMGSGAFKVREFVPGDHVTIERNPDHTWGPPFLRAAAPSIDAVEFRFIPDDSTRVAALQSGQVNLIQTVPPRDQLQLRNNSAFTIIPARKNGQNAGFNMQFDRAPTNDLKVRQAISYAVDRDALNESVYAGTNFPAYTILEQSMGRWVNQNAVFPKHDLDKAKALLDQDGWRVGPGGIRVKDGRQLRVTGIASQGESDAMTLLQAELKEAGISMQIQTVSLAAMAEIVSGTGAFNLAWQAAYGFPGTDPAMLYTLYASRNSPPVGRTNFGHVSIPQVDALLAKALVTVNPDQRKQLYDEVQQLLVDNVAYLPLISFNTNLAAVNGVHDIVPDARGQYYYFSDAWMDRGIQSKWQ